MEQQEMFPELELGESIGGVESACLARGWDRIIGVDEAGRGPLAGPVYAAAVVLDLDRLEEPWVGKLNDSKKIKESLREELSEAIRREALAWSVCWRDQGSIDQINILEATREAMAQAVEEVVGSMGGDWSPQWVLIDGRMSLAIEWPQRDLVKGDARSLSIAAASILAKVDRDRYMKEQAQRWPEYGFASHKGYGTRAHREAIAEYGPCSLHRLSFGGVREHVGRLRESSGSRDPAVESGA